MVDVSDASRSTYSFASTVTVDLEDHVLSRCDSRYDAGQHGHTSDGSFERHEIKFRRYPRPGYQARAAWARARALRTRSREMMMRWISLVPSPIVHSFASRHMRSTGYSRLYP